MYFAVEKKNKIKKKKKRFHFTEMRINTSAVRLVKSSFDGL
jgi:hypothetical protein